MPAGVLTWIIIVIVLLLSFGSLLLTLLSLQGLGLRTKVRLETVEAELRATRMEVVSIQFDLHAARRDLKMITATLERLRPPA